MSKIVLYANNVRSSDWPDGPPQAYANLVEQINQTVKTMIRPFLKKSHTKWNKHIDELAFAYNTAIHDTAGASPAFLNYGHHP